MKTAIALVIIFMLGGFLGSQYGAIFNIVSTSGDKGSKDSDKNKPLYWVAPMDKNYRRDEPGLSPMGMDLVPVYVNETADEDTSGEGDVYISATVENNLGVKTAQVTRSNLYQPIKTVGTVQLDESKIKHVHSRVEGWIEVLNVSSVGDTVKKGQTLYEIYSPALVNAQEEYLAALRSGNNNLIRASKSRLFSLGLDENHAKRLDKRRKVDQRVSVLAEMDGIVINLMVRKGMFIKPATEVISIGSLDTVWIVGEVFERQSYLVSLGQVVDIQFNAMPGKQWRGELSYIYPELDDMTRTLLVLVNIDNSDHLLKPNMLANLSIVSKPAENSLSIPRQALIKSNKHHRVVKSLGDGKYQSVLVKVGYEGLDEVTDIPKIQILEGLEKGDRVVTSAQFLIDSESNIEAELERMNSASNEMMEDASSVMAMGVINNVMAGHNMLNITHEPVEEWGWSNMKMNFDVAPDIDMSYLQEGSEIRFTIKKLESGSIIITEIIVLDSGSKMEDSSTDHSGMSHEEMKHEGMNHGH